MSPNLPDKLGTVLPPLVLLVVALLLVSPLRGQDFTVVHVFDAATGDAALPSAAMIRVAGNFYGTTEGGGAYGYGSVFRFTPGTGEVTVLYSFAEEAGFPEGSLIIDKQHNLYGTTVVGGPSNRGTIFRLDAAGQETVLHAFTGGADGSQPYAGLVRDKAGNLYGTTWMGGEYDLGVVFKVTATGRFSVVHSFSGPGGAYAFPGPLVLDAEGNLYGTTALGGDNDQGTVYKVDPTGTEVVLYSFIGGSDGSKPQAGVIRDEEGNLYGTTLSGGAEGYGTVFKLDTTGTKTILHSFSGRDGKSPGTASLLRDKCGHLYGTTPYGGSGGWGVVYELDEDGNETVLHNFKWAKQGRVPEAGLVQDKNGNLYGSTSEGGITWGTLFRLKTR
jgi:uncharacterized repeat protein (TIGR03803 family)